MRRMRRMRRMRAFLYPYFYYQRALDLPRRSASRISKG
jgi:hypothetical protein